MLATEELLVEAGQSEQLIARVVPVLRRVPLYGRREVPECLSQADFRRLPFITKADIRRDFPANFLGEDGRLEALLEQQAVELEHTSGTGEPRTPLLLPRGWWAEQERRALRLNPIAAEVLAQAPDPRRITIASPVCSGDICFTGVPSRSERTVGNTLFLSRSRFPFLWSENELARMAAEAMDWQPQLLDVDPVYGVVFARYCERHGIRLPSLKFVLASYEFVSVVHRRVLERVFNVPLFNLYGSTETGHLLMEDDCGQMRPSLETAYLEVVDSKNPAEKREQDWMCPSRDSGPDALQPSFQDAAAGRNGSRPAIGELVVTALSNDFMPLVRYRIGDLVEACVTPYHTRYVVHGRAADAFVTRDGRPVTTLQVDQCFSGIRGVLHYQLLEGADGSWLLRFVPDGPGPVDADKSALLGRLTDVLELDAPPTLESTDALLPESSGKFRLGYPARKSPARP